jgi:serine/threonine protein phosphatase PrpC
MTLALRYAVRSDRGLVRSNNEDSVYAGPRLLAIADGMGGHAGGEVASKLVIGVVERLDEDKPLEDLIQAMRAVVDDANVALADSVLREPQLDGMGTTLTALRFVRGHVGLVHVGDSRAYLLRNGQLTQITHDDTYVQSLVDAGRLTAEEASTHPRKSVILRAMTGAEIEPDLSIREARKGDRYLLCTDGLSDVVSSPTLLETLSFGTTQEAADQLVELALRGGGPDNVTCIVADVVDGEGDEIPIVAGAVLEPSASTDPSAEFASPASRAARMTRRDELPPTIIVVRPRRRRLSTWVLRLAIPLVLVIGVVGMYIWTQTQYFVALQGDDVTVFRGVNADFGPLKLYSAITVTDVESRDLTQAARGQVAAGIDAQSKADAIRIIERLREDLLPICASIPTATPSSTLTPSVTLTPSFTPTPTAGSTGTSGATGTVGAGSTDTGVSSPAPSTPVSTPAGSTATAGSTPSGTDTSATGPATGTGAGLPAGSGTGTPPGLPAGSGTGTSSTTGASSSTPSPSPSNTPVPGLDCRTTR